MKKVSVLVIILIIFNFICTSFFGENYVYASDDNYEPMTMDDYKAMSDEGRTTISAENGNVEQEISMGESDTGAVSSQLGTLIAYLSATCAKSMTDFAKNDGKGFYRTDSEFSAKKTGLFTINSLIFGEYLIFNAKAYQKSTDINSSITPEGIVKHLDDLKESGANIGNFFNKFARILALPMILFVIVKTIMAKRADDVAAWKKILASWALCLFLIYFFDYILVAIDIGADTLTESFWNIRLNFESSGYKPFEATVEKSVMASLRSTGGIISLAYGIEFGAIIILQVMFMVKYAFRLFSMIVLFIIAPIVILLHSFNLMLGKNNDILGEFFKSYIVLSFMQPLHALFYIIFLISLSEIAINVPIIGILFIYTLYRAESVAKAMLGWELGSSILSFKK